MAAIDWMRGLVMVLMAIDHASLAFNGGRLGDDSWYAHEAGSALPAAQFFTRWITHLCAPTFVFLAGTALALSFERRRLAGALDRDLDRHLFKRALVILAFELLWWSPFSLQVLFAIAMGLICMIPLRRLSTRTLLIVALSILFLHEALFWSIMHLGGITADMIREVTKMPMPDGDFDQEGMSEAVAQVRSLGWMSVFNPFFHPGLLVKIGPIPLWVQYPFVPWLGMMILGWLLGRYLVQQSVAPTPSPNVSSGPTVDAREGALRSSMPVERLLVIAGLLALGLFVLFRAWNGYGNMLLLREDFSLVQWLYVSKYPPSLTFALLELGLMALILSGFFWYQRYLKGPIRNRNPLLVFGQTAFFFYLIHMHILIFSGLALGMFMQQGLGAAYLAALGVLILLYPVCLWFRRFKARRPKGWVRYI
ncbi:MAG: heparan-alpha-glucosaminide N-acetyltransferase domain-containing protein [Gemmatimonadetes bacterium]|nr:heparan-alpha-glucosaminide N-acetyltransferase domain-containing protein [Gemmatimonadota bacterium]